MNFLKHLSKSAREALWGSLEVWRNCRRPKRNRMRFLYDLLHSKYYQDAGAT
jgi:hypothetical protein